MSRRDNFLAESIKNERDDSIIEIGTEFIINGVTYIVDEIFINTCSQQYIDYSSTMVRLEGCSGGSPELYFEDIYSGPYTISVKQSVEEL